MNVRNIKPDKLRLSWNNALGVLDPVAFGLLAKCHFNIACKQHTVSCSSI